MRAVVLVGGEGTRLRPLTLTAPKQMLPIVEVPMIQRVLDHLGAHGVEEAVLSLGYRPDPFLSLFPGDRAGSVRLTYAVEPEPLGTAGAIRFAAEAAGFDETFVAVNGDVLTDLDVTALVDLHRKWSAEGTIALTRVPDPSAFGLVPTAPDGRVLAFVEKPLPGESHATATGAVNAGTYVLEPSVLDRIPAGRFCLIEREVFPPMAEEGCLFAAVSEAYWTDTGTPALYLQAHLDLLDGLRPPPPAPDARLRDGAEVRDSVILPGAAVHAHAVVDGSIVGEGAVVGEGARLTGLTVVGGGVEVDADARLYGVRVPVGG